MISVTGRPALLRLRGTCQATDDNRTTAKGHADIDQDEISITDPSLSERLSSEAPSLLAYHRTAIRLYMILERIVTKINMPACTQSSAINAISREGGTRRYRETEAHYAGCESDHRSTGFKAEIQCMSIAMQVKKLS